MSIEVKELLTGIKIVDEKGNPTLELIEVIQRIVASARDHEARIVTLEP